MSKFLILTDLEGVAGTDSFSQTRTSDCGPEGKGPSMRQLGREVNACVRGIAAACPGAAVDVFDGHGTGGLFPGDLRGCQLLPTSGMGKYLGASMAGYAGFLFVGQHAMAGTVNAPLCHTFSSRTVQYYRINGVYVGEFGLRALAAGLQGVPTIFLSGDDKAALEARMFVPEIETAITKIGKGLERADHVDADEACRRIEAGAARAVRRLGEIPPFTALEAPFEVEVRHYEPLADSFLEQKPGATRLDERTYRYRAANAAELSR